jgi:hypothetical protein
LKGEVENTYRIVKHASKTRVLALRASLEPASSPYGNCI